ncbi:SIMPL domain-containing protein [Dialister sp.]|uniref:SIMPL domain-containing protein n=1 Tax=Dialister sp. TaxID=1955814 RepID=UPI002E81A863|nr:SIMPL domain-containing protein [Dialister sp.]MEE3453807.1 SIMPL domain-containing protein [Dialister sp.]
MNKKVMALVASGLILFSGLTAQAEEPRRSIMVTGTSEVTAKSDMATVNITVETRSPNAKAAVRENANTMTDVRNAVIAAGAEASKIETQNYNVYPQQIYNNKGEVKSKEYRCDNTMKVVVMNLSKTGAIMDAAVEAGANRIDSVDFSVSDTQMYKDAALRKAAEDAARKARIIAAGLGRNIIGVISASEDNVNVMPYRMVNLKMSAAAAREDAVTPIDPGESKLQGRVTVVFEID